MKLANLIPEQLEKIKNRAKFYGIYIAKAGIMAGFSCIPPIALRTDRAAGLAHSLSDHVIEDRHIISPVALKRMQKH